MTDLTPKQQAEVKKEVYKQLEVKLNKERKKITEKILKSTTYVGTEYKKQVLTALMAAFGLVIALSWQELIKKLVTNIPKSGILLYHPYLADLYTAIIVTFIGVIAIILLSKWAQPKEPKIETQN